MGQNEIIMAKSDELAALMLERVIAGPIAISVIAVGSTISAISYFFGFEQWWFALVFTVAGGGGNYIWKTWKVRQATEKCNPLELHSAQQKLDRMKREISQKSS